MTQEKRKAKRWKLFHDARFRLPDASTYTDCMLCDVSFWGAKISCQQILKGGDIIEVYMNIPDNLHPLITKAKVAYCRPMHRFYYEYGLVFVDIKQKDREKIFDYIYKNYPAEFGKLMRTGEIKRKGGEEEMLVKEAAFDDRRVFARIQVDLLARYFDNASNKEGYFHVRDISAKGMGIETKEKFKPKTHLEIWLTIPASRALIYTKGEVVWQGPDEARKGYRIGINLDQADFMNCPTLLKQ